MASLGWRFDHSYARLPEAMFARVAPARARDPRVVVFNHALADSLGLAAGAVDSQSLAASLSGNALPEGALPLAQAYAGHQFGHFAMLGDGRALLVGEHLCPDGSRVDIHFKGSGPTPFSRRGDGRAALGPMLREYLISEAMHALGIPTTRSLAVVATGEAVFRENLLDGAVLTRVARSHLRVGTFEYASARNEPELLDALIRYAIDRHYPDCAAAERPALALLNQVIDRQASLVVRWLRVGFIHGVMNTDNMSICGETIDYGPCAFLERYDPAVAFSSIDQGKRYAFGNQPSIAQWNLARLAEALLPAIDADADQALALAEEAVNRFAELYRSRQVDMMRAKLGLAGDSSDDEALITDFLGWMRERDADYTKSFSMLSAGRIAAGKLESDSSLAAWHQRWQARLQAGGEPLHAVTSRRRATPPVYFPRNHPVEAALAAATGPAGDLQPLERLLDVLKRPYLERPGLEAYTQPAPDAGRGYQTFCGT
ncbi:MAG: protein adenylyltransferase SelO [Betaproteobacteria bacterium]